MRTSRSDSQTINFSGILDGEAAWALVSSLRLMDNENFRSQFEPGSLLECIELMNTNQVKREFISGLARATCARMISESNMAQYESGLLYNFRHHLFPLNVTSVEMNITSLYTAYAVSCKRAVVSGLQFFKSVESLAFSNSISDALQILKVLANAFGVEIYLHEGAIVPNILTSTRDRHCECSEANPPVSHVIYYKNRFHILDVDERDVRSSFRVLEQLRAINRTNQIIQVDYSKFLDNLCVEQLSAERFFKGIDTVMPHLVSSNFVSLQGMESQLALNYQEAGRKMAPNQIMQLEDQLQKVEWCTDEEEFDCQQPKVKTKKRGRQQSEPQAVKKVKKDDREILAKKGSDEGKQKTQDESQFGSVQSEWSPCGLKGGLIIEKKSIDAGVMVQMDSGEVLRFSFAQLAIESKWVGRDLDLLKILLSIEEEQLVEYEKIKLQGVRTLQVPKPNQFEDKPVELEGTRSGLRTKDCKTCPEAKQQYQSIGNQ